MAQLTPLGTAALRLRNLHSGVFNDFVEEIDAYAMSLMNDVVHAPSSDILAAQGRAQSMQALLRVLKECHLARPQAPSQPVPQPPAP